MNKLRVATTDETLIGTDYDVKITVSLDVSAYITPVPTATETFNIKLVYDCKNAVIDANTLSPVTDPPQYTYSTSDYATWNVDDLIVTPSSCPIISHNCLMSPTVGLYAADCDGGSSGDPTFFRFNENDYPADDRSAGDFRFRSSDFTEYGSATLTFTVTLCTHAETCLVKSFDLVLVDPCVGMTITVNPAQTAFTYNIYDDSSQEMIDLSSSFPISHDGSQSICTPLVNDCTLDPSGSLPGGHLSYESMTNSLTLNTNDVSDIGIYSLKYTVTLTGKDYTKTAEVLFTVEFVDLCGTHIPVFTNADETAHLTPTNYYYTGINEQFYVAQTQSDITTKCDWTWSCEVTYPASPHDFDYLCDHNGFGPGDTATKAHDHTDYTDNASNPGYSHFDFSSTECETIGDQLIIVQFTMSQAQGTHSVPIHLNLIDPCLSNSLTFKSTIMPASTDYKIYPTNSAWLETFLSTSMGFDDSQPDCPIGFTMKIEEVDASLNLIAIDSTVFTFDEGTNTFNTFTRDTGKDRTVDFRISIKIDSSASKYALPSLEAFQTFRIVLIDWCSTSPTITVGTINQTPTTYYYQLSEKAVYEITDFTSTMPTNECPLTVSC